MGWEKKEFVTIGWNCLNGHPKIMFCKLVALNHFTLINNLCIIDRLVITGLQSINCLTLSYDGEEEQTGEGGRSGSDKAREGSAYGGVD